MSQTQRQRTEPTPKKREVAFAVEEDVEIKPRKSSTRSRVEGKNFFKFI